MKLQTISKQTHALSIINFLGLEMKLMATSAKKRMVDMMSRIISDSYL